MIAQALAFVLETLFTLFALAALLRFYAQALRAPFRNPVTDFVVALTDFAVKPMRRVFPSALGLDTASFLLAWIALVVMLVLEYALLAHSALAAPSFWPSILVIGLVRLMRLTIYLLMGAIIVQVILSWTNPYHPLAPFFSALTRPFLRPLQRLVPLVGGVDLSPLLLWIALQLVLMLPVAALERAVSGPLPRLFAG